MVPGTMGELRLGVRERVLDFLARYGERGYAVLRAILETYYSGQGSRGVRLGDFSYRDVVNRLRAWGLEYNPSMLLRVLEREYGVVETSYSSRNQHWWRISSPEEVAAALEEYEAGVNAEESGGDEVEDPEVELLRLQIASLDPDGILERLEKLSVRPRLSRQELLVLRSLAFNELELVVKLLRRAEELGYEGPEVGLLREILAKASRLARKVLAGARLSSEARKTLIEMTRIMR